MDNAACVQASGLWYWITTTLWENHLWSLFVAVVVAALIIVNVFIGFTVCKRAPEAPDQDFGDGDHGNDYDCDNDNGENNVRTINIRSHCAQRRYFCQPLKWCYYGDVPTFIRLQNNGHTLILRACFRCNKPCIEDGHLMHKYEFCQIAFRWSWYNDAGSEHTIDEVHYPLEMQCMHICDCSTDGSNANRGPLMICYLFVICDDNPYLDVLIRHLVVVQQAGRTVDIPPFPLRYLMPDFNTQFYSYHGSLMESPQSPRMAEWLVFPKPISIGERQLNEFRQLRAYSGARIGRNARTVEEEVEPTFYFNCYRSQRR